VSLNYVIIDWCFDNKIIKKAQKIKN